MSHVSLTNYFHMKEKVAIVIPIYKPHLTQFEAVAIDKCFCLLGCYPIYSVAPQSLNIDHVVKQRSSAETIRFEDSYFKNIASYNRLMLSSCFYKSFAQYEYILIYQPDAYIFTDDLISWCKKGYDYIGAPWIPAQKYEHPHYKFGLQIINFLGKLTCIKTGTDNYLHVGNGGFSLRKVESFISIIQQEEERINYYLARKGTRFNEDVFWGVEMVKRHKNFKVPQWEEALGFSFDVRPHLAYKYAKNKLPMGCHGWQTQSHFQFWQSHIPTYSRIQASAAK
jgi:hypothetical protein